MIVTLATPQVIAIGEPLVVSNVQDAQNAISSFIQNLNKVHGPVQVEYHIVNGFSKYRPNPLTSSIESIFRASIATNRAWKLEQQTKKELSGEALTKFKNGLIDLNQISGIQGFAWEHHLWAVAYHATKSSHKKVLKEIFGLVNRLSTRTKAGKTQFDRWYAQL